MLMKKSFEQLINSLTVFNGRSRFTKNDSFKEFLTDYYNDASAYLKLFKQCLNCHGIQTQQEISFSNSFGFESSLNEVQASLSKLKYMIIENDTLNTKILFYRLIQNGHKTKCHLHFFNGKLFLCSYTFSYIDQNQRNELIEKLHEKYQLGQVNYRRQNILDHSNNYIQFNEHIDFSINYVSLNSVFFKSITNPEIKSAKHL